MYRLQRRHVEKDTFPTTSTEQQETSIQFEVRRRMARWLTRKGSNNICGLIKTRRERRLGRMNGEDEAVTGRERNRRTRWRENQEGREKESKKERDGKGGGGGWWERRKGCGNKREKGLRKEGKEQRRGSRKVRGIEDKVRKGKEQSKKRRKKGRIKERLEESRDMGEENKGEK